MAGPHQVDGFYIPCGEPRMIENPVKPRIHQSVLDRKTLVPDYKPVNFPAQYDVEPWPYAPGSGAPAPVQPPAA